MALDLRPAPAPTCTGPQARPCGGSVREHEDHLVAAVLAAGRGGLVWTGEPGSGRSTTLQRAVRQVDVVAPGPFLVRVAGWRTSSPVPAGTGLRNLVAQLDHLTGGLPDGARRAVESAADGAGPPQVMAVRFAGLVREACGGRPLVVAVDDLDHLDAFSREGLVAVVVQSRVPFVLLATAEDGDALRALPHPVERRAVPVLDARDAMDVVAHDRRLPVAPRVGDRLARELVGNVGAIVQTGRLLSAEQLAGTSALPDPLPAVEAVRRCCGAGLEACTEADRHVLLVAALCVVDRAEVLLRACGTTPAAVLRSGAGEQLVLAGGRFRFADPRVRSLVRAGASMADRAAVHARLAAVHASLGQEGAALWHRSRADLAGGDAIVPDLLRLARGVLDTEAVGWALEVAQDAASRASETSSTRAEALALAGRAALGGGWVSDAARLLRQAFHEGDLHRQVAVLPDLVRALALTEGQVPDGVLAQCADDVAQCADDVAPCAREAAQGAGEAAGSGHDALLAAGLARGYAAAACLHAERGDGEAACRSLAKAHRLGLGADGSAQADVALATGWLRLFGLRPGGGLGAGAQDGATPASPPAASVEHRAASAVCAALASGLSGDVERAERALASVLATFVPVRGGGRPPFPVRAEVDRTDAVAPAVEALVRVARTLVLCWRGDLADAGDELDRAARTLPVGMPLAGLAAVLARRTDLAVHGEVGAVAAALEATSGAPAAPHARTAALADRALLAQLDGRLVEAATLLDVVEEREAAFTARPLPVPGVDAMTAWALTGRTEDARAAAVRTQRTADRLPPLVAGAVMARAALLQSDAASLPVALARAQHVGHGAVPGAQRVDLELVAGSVLAWCGDLAGARTHLLLAAELLRDTGAAAWADLVARQVADGAGAGAEHAPDGGVAARRRERWAAELTERELDVAMLVAEGASNRAAADRLFLSVRTVEVHLGRVFRKLGVRSRVELALLVHRVRQG